MRKPAVQITGPAIALCLGLTFSPSAFAYLDPGTGSILLQSLLAGIAVAIGVVRTYWYRIKSFFAGGPQYDAEPKPESDQSPRDTTSET